ncbi:MAG TPA: sulfite exporter TauE/SafE family protein [Candidatus Krumholzibacteria bacterium]|nr:sulfite exporter TauE/SafE family protein [Candidatus Krumholzibacteria bacterium]
MMEPVVICAVALVASMITVFSGFGLGTLLLPVFAIFFPTSIAVAMTALVHFGNNLVKLALFGRWADKTVLRRFGLPALLASFVGARLLVTLADDPPVATYKLFGSMHDVTRVGIVVGMLIAAFAAWEAIPRLSRLGVDPKYLAAGGALSGFFGGLSGHQGALRSAFLVRCGLSKEAFIATGVVIACAVDAARLFEYGRDMDFDPIRQRWTLVVAAIACAAAGAVLAARVLPRVSMNAIRRLVTVMLFVVAVLLMAGLV